MAATLILITAALIALIGVSVIAAGWIVFSKGPKLGPGCEREGDNPNDLWGQLIEAKVVGTICVSVWVVGCIGVLRCENLTVTIAVIGVATLFLLLPGFGMLFSNTIDRLPSGY